MNMKNFIFSGVIALGLAISPLQGSAMRALSVGSLATSAALCGKSLYRVRQGSPLVRNELIAASAALVTGFFSWHLATDAAEDAKKAATVKAPDAVLPKLAEEKRKAEAEAQDLKRQLGEVRTAAEQAQKAADDKINAGTAEAKRLDELHKAAQAAQKAAEDKANVSDAEAKRLDAARLAAEKQLQDELARRAEADKKLQEAAADMNELMQQTEASDQQLKEANRQRARLYAQLLELRRKHGAERKQQAAELQAAAQAEPEEVDMAVDLDALGGQPDEPAAAAEEEQKEDAADEKVAAEEEQAEEAAAEEPAAPAEPARLSRRQRKAARAAALAAEQAQALAEAKIEAERKAAAELAAAQEEDEGASFGTHLGSLVKTSMVSGGKKLWNGTKSVASFFKSGLSRGL